MNTFVIVLVAVAMLESANAITKDYIAKAMAAKDKCMKEFNIDQSEIMEFMKAKKLPDSQNGKCAINCFMEEFNGMSNGKMNVDVLKSNNKQKWESADIVAKADKIVDDCNTELSLDGKDKCDAAYEVTSCMMKKAIEANIPKPDFANPTRR